MRFLLTHLEQGSPSGNSKGRGAGEGEDPRGHSGMFGRLEGQGLRREGTDVGKEGFWKALRLSTNQECVRPWSRVTFFPGYLPVASTSISTWGLSSVLRGLRVRALPCPVAGRSCPSEVLVEKLQEETASASGSQGWPLLVVAGNFEK